MDFISYSTSTPTQDASPVRVNFARPLCFCGFTAVSIYPEPPPATISRQSRSAPTPPSSTVKKTNWVYECHFSSKQKGMTPPDPCQDCERGRKRRTARGRFLARNTKELTWFAGPNSGGGCERHRAVQYDEVELWPRKKPVTTTTTTNHDNSDTTSTQVKKAVVGADIQVEAIYLNAAPMDGQKVCGFHMHALEWHHMQTLNVNQILMVAMNTPCDHFHLSIILWLGDLAKTTTIKNSNIDTNYHLSLKLFQKVGCFCKKEAVLAKGPKLSTSYTLLPGSTTPIYHNERDSSDKEYFVMCAGRVYDNHTDYEMVPQPGTDACYNYNIRSWVKKSGGFFQCAFQLPLQKAIFQHALLPIHSRIYVTDWLSQWFEPVPLTPPTQPLTAFPSGPVWLQRTNELLTAIRGPTTTPSSSKANGPSLQAPLIPTTPGSTMKSKGLATAQDFRPDELMVSSIGVLVKEQDQLKSANGLFEIDNELNEALMRHTTTIKSIKERTAKLSSWSKEQDRHYKEIDMAAYSSVTILLCDKCKRNNTRDFCVIPRAGSLTSFPPPSPSSQYEHRQNQKTTTTFTQTAVASSRSTHLPSPEGSDNEHVDAPGAQADEPFDHMDPLTGLVAFDAELEQADRELEATMTRHAQVFERTMEIRSRLVPDFFQCRGCCYQEVGVDVLPCHHHFLCAECVDLIKFYLVPHDMRG
ncbi:hypothetical protein BG015_000933 [Linnemannia schmuckeri]|uniref:Uncharacterized protein n=1 Tax=Linnemannia schmuckeri TaxID=64567 RepID=A0A9P5V794_9FUNG|nr:hypothetical protein BG015_000933 [Linnemannia schmuckeri]